MTALIVLSCVILLLALDLGRLWLKQKQQQPTPVALRVRPFSALKLPRGLFLDRSHTWLRLTESGEFRIGIDELLVQATDGADRIDLPPVGLRLERGDVLATLWRRGRKLTLSSPVGGTVVMCNHELERAGKDLAQDPYGAGWLATLWPTEHREALKPLNVGEAARKWLQNEVARFSDFLASHDGSTLGPALGDGAHPVVGAALHLDDDSWTEFQASFARCE
jgi:glycine cleavage system H lipoate-binding protein